MSDPQETPFDICKCGWTRVQHCATEPHQCTAIWCGCKEFRHDPQKIPYGDAIRGPEDLRVATWSDDPDIGGFYRSGR